MARKLLENQSIRSCFPAPFDSKRHLFPLPSRGVKKPGECLEKEKTSFQKKFQVSVEWVRILYTNKLPWFRPSAVSIRENRLNTCVFLGESCRNRAIDKGLEEVVHHEFIHLCRQRILGDTSFEEMLAYFYMNSFWKRLIAPVVFSKSIQVLLSAALILFCFVDFSFGLQDAFLVKLFASLFIVLSLQAQYFSLFFLKNKLKRVLRDGLNVDALLIRLTQEEIALFSKLSREEISKVACSWSLRHFRWEGLYRSFFS
ncbi:MAG: hypothetical protein GWP59_02550 [Chlamydiales bacterium]|nr:hypothetical protein [Chlamydiales bacterium]